MLRWLALIAVGGLACAEPGPVAWRVVFEDEVAAETAVVRTSILAGGCEGDTLVYESELRGAGTGEAPELEAGTYGLRVEVRDASCRVIGGGCAEIGLPTTVDEAVVVVSAMPGAQVCGPERCDDGVCGDAPPCAGCVIEGECVEAEAVHPERPCDVCRPTISRSEWSQVAGTSCDDGDGCTVGDRCDEAGVCAGAPRSCDDGLGCTTERCEAGDCVYDVLSGCAVDGMCLEADAPHPSDPCLRCNPEVAADAWSPMPVDTACSDGAFCTVEDACDEAGVCVGTARLCDDGRACTEDTCDEERDTCAASVLPDRCLIDGACLDDMEPRPGAPCEGCVAATSTSSWSPLSSDVTCDDLTFCTVDDRCDGAGACAGTPRDCGDGFACTDDACDEGLEQCVSTPNGEGCFIDGACVAEGSAADDVPCLRCVPTLDPGRYVAASGSACGVGGMCDTLARCDLRDRGVVIESVAAESRQFGRNVAIWGTHLAVGTNWGFSGTLSGSVYMFELQDDGSWMHIDTLISESPATSDYFGDNFDLEGDMLAVGSPGPDLIEVFTFDSMTGHWVRDVPVVGAPGFAYGVTISMGRIAGRTAGGCTEIWQRDGMSWVTEGCLESDTAISDIGFYGDLLVYGIARSFAPFIHLRRETVDDWPIEESIALTPGSFFDHIEVHGDRFLGVRGSSIMLWSLVDGTWAQRPAPFVGSLADLDDQHVLTAGLLYRELSDESWREVARFGDSTVSSFGRSLDLGPDHVVIGGPDDRNMSGRQYGTVVVFPRSGL